MHLHLSIKNTDCYFLSWRVTKINYLNYELLKLIEILYIKYIYNNYIDILLYKNIYW